MRASAGRPMPKRWIAVFALLGLLVVVAGAGVGGRVGGQRHHAEARLVVGQQTITAQAVPGYAVAIEQLAVTYARLAQGDYVSKAITAAAGPDAHVSLKASAISDSAVIRLQTTADSDLASLKAADAAAKALEHLVVLSRSSQVLSAALETRLLDAHAAMDTANGARDKARTAYDGAGALSDAQRKRLFQRKTTTEAAARAASLRTNTLNNAYQENVRASVSTGSNLFLFQKGTSLGSSQEADAELGGLVGLTLTLGAAGLVVWRRRGERR